MDISVQLRVLLMVQTYIWRWNQGYTTTELHLKMHMEMHLLVKKSAQNVSIKGEREEALDIASEGAPKISL